MIKHSSINVTMHYLCTIWITAVCVFEASTAGPTGFRYQEDCPALCVQRQESCTIEEVNHDFFAKTCYVMEDACIAKAAPMTVCLRLDRPQEGGSPREWMDYRRKYYPDPAPSPPQQSYIIILYLTVSFVVGALIGKFTGPVIRSVRSRFNRTSEREPLLNEPENPVYRSTTVPVE
jgi:hypothetical protein